MVMVMAMAMMTTITSYEIYANGSFNPQYTFPFEFQLPTGLPGSFYTVHGDAQNPNSVYHLAEVCMGVY